MGEERAGRRRGDARNRRERLLGWRRTAALGTLREGRPVHDSGLETSHRQAHHPGCAVIAAFAPHDRHTKVGDGEQGPPNAVGSEATVTKPERLPFDQKAGTASGGAQLLHLVPEPALLNGEVQIHRRLAFHDTAGREHVVAAGQRSNRHTDAEQFQRAGNTRPSLVHIGNDLQHLRDPARHTEGILQQDGNNERPLAISPR